MATSHALANAPYMECLPIGMTVLDSELNIAYYNHWMRDRLVNHKTPLVLSDLADLGDANWQNFLTSVPAMGTRLAGDFALKLGGIMPVRVSVSIHRLNPPLEHVLVMVVSDISEILATEERLRGTLSSVSELSDIAIAQARELKRLNAALEERVHDRTNELRRANMDALRMLAVACEAKDHDTGQHVERVQRYTEILARELGFNEKQAHEFGYSAILHDVGKVHIPDSILTKPGPLTPEERIVINEHPIAGERILGANAFFATARHIARQHHESWDGSGYPDGLSQHAIAIEARIVHVADVFDALTSRRPYKAAWSVSDALKQIQQQSAVSFDPDVSAALASLHDRNALLTPAA